jgi:hypothetical protein
MKQMFVDLIERFSKYENLDVCKVINDVINGMVGR